MKFDIQKAFPYPVLRPYSDDYNDAEFQTIVDIEIHGDNMRINISYLLSSNDILQQIQNGKAEYVAIISCRDTYTRHVLQSIHSKIERDFKIYDFRGEVKVQPYIVVKDKISFYQSNEINKEFGPGPFEFSEGDVLAQDEPQVFYIERDFFKPITSVFELVQDDQLKDGRWTVALDTEHVQIKVSPSMKEVLDNARNSKKNRAILINSIYFAAVMQSILMLKSSPEEFDDYKWAKVIKGKAHNKGIDISALEAYEAAQQLMDYPLKVLEINVFGGD
jgi:hypothetical protein